MGVVEVVIIGMVGLLMLLIAVELMAPARRFQEVPGWRAKCLLVFVPVVVAISAGVPFLLDGVLDGVRLLPGHRLGIVGGTAAGILISELVIYWVHRLHHRVGILWRWVHQLHHSAERVDVFGAAFFHPLEILEGTVVGVLFFNVVLGLAPEAAALAILWQVFAGVFQHGNLRTPTWLGYLIQRPEQHGLHHQRGIHGYNYSNLPVWDLLFGTFRNPATWDGVAGFFPGASRRTMDMLIGRDVSNPSEGPSS